jgi:hypothetical protein
LLCRKSLLQVVDKPLELRTPNGVQKKHQHFIGRLLPTPATSRKAAKGSSGSRSVTQIHKVTVGEILANFGFNFTCSAKELIPGKPGAETVLGDMAVVTAVDSASSVRNGFVIIAPEQVREVDTCMLLGQLDC